MGRLDHDQQGARAVRLKDRTTAGVAAALIGAALALAGCATPSAERASPFLAGRYPPFATRPDEPFSRQAVVAIALREWRLFGQLVDDDPPGTRPPPDPDAKPERLPGLWQRVGEYWWLGMPADRRESAWTGKHDEDGAVFAADEDGRFPWSAAFISYVMRIAGAGTRFPYSALHADYINAAAGGAAGTAALRAEAPQAYAPQPGDLICFGRRDARTLRFEDLPAAPFAGHCDIVVAADPGQLGVIGGNVDDAVTMKHVPVTPGGYLATPAGEILDGRYSWFVVIRVLYDVAGSAPPAIPSAERAIRPMRSAS